MYSSNKVEHIQFLHWDMIKEVKELHRFINITEISHKVHRFAEVAGSNRPI